jgi:hypothetical protein
MQSPVASRQSPVHHYHTFGCILKRVNSGKEEPFEVDTFRISTGGKTM